MPSPKKVAWAQLRVGIMAVIAFFLLGTLIFLLTGSRGLFIAKSVLYTTFPDSIAITEGSAVRLNGILVGKITNIRLSGEADPMRTIRMDIEVSSDMLKSIPVDSTAALAAENLLGTKYINITRGKSKETVKPGSELRSEASPDFSDLAKMAEPTLAGLNIIVRRVDSIVSQVEAGKGTIGRLLVEEEIYNRLVKTIAEVQKIAEYVGSGRGSVGRLLYDEAIYQELRATLARVDKIIAELDEGRGTAGKLLKDEQLYEEARQTVAGIRKTVDDLNAGKGTAGKLLKDETLHNQISALVKQLDTMVAKVNSGEGTLGQLLVNPQLYESINGTSTELSSLLKDFRANPKKFLTIQLKLF
jgi:phospholipid/cholesterol/gamma-HCH transport system substrate-binding protein